MGFYGPLCPLYAPPRGSLRVSMYLYPLNTEGLLGTLLDTRLHYGYESAKHIYNPLYDDAL